ncbi:unnamed protein product [Rhodiola kirilowii]
MPAIPNPTILILHRPYLKASPSSARPASLRCRRHFSLLNACTLSGIRVREALEVTALLCVSLLHHRSRRPIMAVAVDLAFRGGFSERKCSVDFPVLESEALFIREAGEEIREQLYCFEDRGNRRVALRPELTPSLARLAQIRNLISVFFMSRKYASLPLKWFAVGQCWRYERMTRGRRREHYQWNMDIIGVPEVTAEAELISSIVMLFRRMGITESDVGFKISSRKVLQEVLKSYSIPDNLFGKVCIIIDKIQKIPRDEIKKELGIVGLSDDAIEELLQVLSIKSLDKLEEGHDGLLHVHVVSASSVDQLYVVPFLGDLSCSAALGGVALKLERAFPVDNNNGTVELSYLKSRDKVSHGRRLDSVDGVVDFPVDGVDPYLVGLYFTRVQLGTPPKEFYVQIDTGSDVLWVTCAGCTGCPRTSGLNLFSLAENFGYSNWIQFDASIVRSLAYYTGIVFEGFDRQGKLRAICGGGRLLSTFGGDDIPACGFGFGDAVIVETSYSKVQLLKEKGLLPARMHENPHSSRGATRSCATTVSGGQSLSTSGSVGSPTRSDQPATTPVSQSTFLRLNHLDIHADDADAQGKKKKRGQRTVGGDKNGRGLRQFSMKVCEKVESKGRTTYNEVADELVAEFADPAISLAPDQQQYDEKNIRRRVYDALNVLMAMDIISKDKKEIQWKGLPRTTLNDVEELRAQRMALRNRIEKKEAYLQELEEQYVGLQNLIQRNQQLCSSENAPSQGVQLPFILVQTCPDATVEVEMSEDMQLMHFDFNSTLFKLHDENFVLKAMNFCQRCQIDASDAENKNLSNTPGQHPASPPLPRIIKARGKHEH